MCTILYMNKVNEIEDDSDNDNLAGTLISAGAVAAIRV